MHGDMIDAGGDMIALKCPACGEVDDAHDCQPKKWDDPRNAKHKQFDLDYKWVPGYGGGKHLKENRWEVPDDEARLMSSELKEQPEDAPWGTDSIHTPVLDIDFPCRLVPSTTPGHFHLILDGLEIPWSKYSALLSALSAAGVIEEGYAGAAIRRQASFLWKPGCKPAEAKRPEPDDEPDPDPNPWLS